MRKIDLIVIHCSATRADRSLTPDARQTPAHRNSVLPFVCLYINCRKSFPVAGCAVIATSRPTATETGRLNRKSGLRRARALK